MEDNKNTSLETEETVDKATEEQKHNKAKKKKSKVGKIIGFSILGLVVIAIAVAAIWVIPAVTNPASMFETTSTTAIAAAAATAVPADQPGEVSLELVTDGQEKKSAVPEATAEPTPEPTVQEQGQFDNIINIALLGIDPQNKSYAADGGDSHTDGIVVVSVNFDTNTVNMISFPRDTFTKVPGHEGFYKINCAVDVGGEGTDAGFMTTCATLSQFLGGVPVNYYIAIDHNMVITLGDEIGGVDFDLPFSYTGKVGGTYKKGYQHLDGKGIYDYMRCRKECPYPYNTDLSRTQRCREMLLAIFEKLKSENMLTKIPDIMSTVSSGIYTNLSSRQILALGTYAMNFSTSDVGSYNFDGSLEMSNGWVFYFIDQDSRKEILNTVYGIDAEPIGWCSSTYADWLYSKGFTALKYLKQAQKVLAYADSVDGGLNTEMQTLYDACVTARDELQVAFDETSSVVQRNYTGEYSSEDKAAKSDGQTQMTQKESALKKATVALYKALGSPDTISLAWKVKQWYKDSDICEVIVDMR